MSVRVPKLLWPIVALLVLSAASLLTRNSELLRAGGAPGSRARGGLAHAPAAPAEPQNASSWSTTEDAEPSVGDGEPVNASATTPKTPPLVVRGEFLRAQTHTQTQEGLAGGALSALPATDDAEQTVGDGERVNATAEAPATVRDELARAHAHEESAGGGGSALPDWLHQRDSLPAVHRARLAAWYAPACQDFHARACRSGSAHGAFSLRNTTRATLPRACVSEDLHARGRAGAYETAPHVAQEVTMSDKHRFVYVEMRKAASSSMREWLLKAYNANWACPRSVRCAERDKFVLYRCTSLCLTQWHVDNYFFFTFVRDPVDRFYSGLKQAAVMHKRSSVSRDEAVSALRGMLDEHTLWDIHLESQSLAGNTPTSRSDEFKVPLDFIGRVETLRSDQEVLQGLIARHAKRPVPPKSVEMLREGGRLNLGGGLKAGLVRIRNEEMDGLVREAYAQDLKCFPKD